MFLTLMWIAVAAGMGTIITAAMKVQNTSLCKGYNVSITGFEDGKLFTSEENIVKLLKAATKGDIKGQRIGDFNLPMIEDLLEQSAWVYNAELYFDNMDILRVKVTERKPLARVFTNVGESFYIDETGRHIPLSEKISLDVPVFTGYPNKKIMNAADSALVQNVIATASFINSDPFWSSQVSQIGISHNGVKGWEMEMMPVVGNHRVQLGDGSDIATKFHRLYLFYDQVLKRKGFDKYKAIDVQYNGQVVGVKGDYTKVDSLQLRKNIETLLAQSRDANELIGETPNIGLSNYIIDTSMASQAVEQIAEQPMEEVKPEVEEAPVVAVAEKKAEPAKKKETVKPAAKPVEAKKAEAKKPEPKKETKKAENKKAEPKKETAKAATKATAKKPEPKKEQPVAKKAAVKKETKPVVKSTDKKTTVAKKPAAAKSAAKTADTKKPAAKPAAKTGTKKSTAAKPAATTKKTTGSNTTTTKKKTN